MSAWIRRRLTKAGDPRYMVLYRPVRGGRLFTGASAGTFKTQREAKVRQQVVAQWLAQGKDPRTELRKRWGKARKEASSRPRKRTRVSPDTPYGNLLALRKLIREGRGAIRWWDPHLPGRALEILYEELEVGRVTLVRLLSGPANVTPATKRDFDRFQEEMRDQRGITTEWRVLSKAEARKHHDRFFITGRMSRNLPPFNSILGGGTGEILPSTVTSNDFDSWWRQGTDLADFMPEQSGS